MDDAAGCFFAAAAIAFATYLAFMAAWVALATLFRGFAIVLMILMILSACALMTGILMGVWTPISVLSGRSVTVPALASPAAIDSGEFKLGEPKGPAARRGWDPAWPTYIPFQARNDAKAVFSASTDACKRAFDHLDFDLDDGFEFTKDLVLLLPVVAYAVGIQASTAIWLATMAVLGVLLTALRFVVYQALRLRDRVTLARDKAIMYCNQCQEKHKIPSYQCSSPSCGNLHHDIRPGTLGVFGRRCACGESLPTTITAAASRLTPHCPSCLAPQSEGAGTRQVLLVPVIGEKGVGKTRHLAAALVGLANAAEERGGSVEGLSPSAKSKLADFRQLIEKKLDTVATSEQVPRGLAVLLNIPDTRPTEIHVFDVAGEVFDSWNSAADLRYLSQANSVLFLIDPFSIESVARKVRQAGILPGVNVAAGNYEKAYSSSVDQLRTNGWDTSKRNLGIVITKADVLKEVESFEYLVRTGPWGIRSWLVEHGLDLLISRIDEDFDEVRFFVTDAKGTSVLDDPVHPLNSLRWMAEKARADWPLMKSKT